MYVPLRRTLEFDLVIVGAVRGEGERRGGAGLGCCNHLTQLGLTQMSEAVRVRDVGRGTRALGDGGAECFV